MLREMLRGAGFVALFVLGLGDTFTFTYAPKVFLGFARRMLSMSSFA